MPYGRRRALNEAIERVARRAVTAGWWAINEDGSKPGPNESEFHTGDGPLDMRIDFLEEVDLVYRQTWDRRITRPELEYLLTVPSWFDDPTTYLNEWVDVASAHFNVPQKTILLLPEDSIKDARRLFLGYKNARFFNEQPKTWAVSGEEPPDEGDALDGFLSHIRASLRLHVEDAKAFLDGFKKRAASETLEYTDWSDRSNPVPVKARIRILEPVEPSIRALKALPVGTYLKSVKALILLHKTKPDSWTVYGVNKGRGDWIDKWASTNQALRIVSGLLVRFELVGQRQASSTLMGTVVSVNLGTSPFKPRYVHFVKRKRLWQEIDYRVQSQQHYGTLSRETKTDAEMEAWNKAGLVGLVVNGFRGKPTEPVHLTALPIGTTIQHRGHASYQDHHFSGMFNIPPGYEIV